MKKAVNTIGRLAKLWFLAGAILLPFNAPAYEQTREPRWLETGIDGVQVRIETGAPYQHVHPGNEAKLAWVVRNASERERSLNMSYSIESFDGGVVQRKLSSQLPAGSEQRRPIGRDALGQLGIKWVKFRFEEGNRKADGQSTSFAYFQPAGPTRGRQRGGFLFSTGYGGGPEPYNEENQELIALAGFKAARFNAGWGLTQPHKGAWNWERTDTAVANHLRYGIEPQFLLYGTPRRAINEKEVRFSDDPKIRARQEKFHTLAFSKPYITGLSRCAFSDRQGQHLDAGLLFADGRRKPEFHALKKLLQESWTTNWEGKLAGAGTACLRGFHGIYEAEIPGHGVGKFSLGPGHATQVIVRTND